MYTLCEDCEEEQESELWYTARVSSEADYDSPDQDPDATVIKVSISHGQPPLRTPMYPLTLRHSMVAEVAN